jgi:hypothetical protein
MVKSLLDSETARSYPPPSSRFGDCTATDHPRPTRFDPEVPFVEGEEISRPLSTGHPLSA